MSSQRSARSSAVRRFDKTGESLDLRREKQMSSHDHRFGCGCDCGCDRRDFLAAISATLGGLVFTPMATGSDTELRKTKRSSPSKSPTKSAKNVPIKVC